MSASFRQFLRMVKFEHTIFGLPFVLMGGVMAAGGVPSAWVLFWMVTAAVGARNFAMSLNRFADRDIDPKNPRTKDRAEFQALLHSKSILMMLAGFLALFLLSAWMLNPLAFALSFAVAAVIVLYSYSKRFTSWTHLFLGFVLGAAPAGAWVAVRGDLGFVPVLLFLGVTLWVGGIRPHLRLSGRGFRRRGGHPLPPAPSGREGRAHRIGASPTWGRWPVSSPRGMRSDSGPFTGWRSRRRGVSCSGSTGSCGPTT